MSKRIIINETNHEPKERKREYTMTASKYKIIQVEETYNVIDFSDYDELFDCLKAKDLVLVRCKSFFPNDYVVMEVIDKKVLNNGIKTLNLSNISVLHTPYDIRIINGVITRPTDCTDILMVKLKEKENK